MTYYINTMREWVKRREAIGKPWNADELWTRIRHNWPGLTEVQMEEVFQGAVS